MAAMTGSEEYIIILEPKFNKDFNNYQDISFFDN
jgi:hypothetical protein